MSLINIRQSLLITLVLTILNPTFSLADHEAVNKQDERRNTALSLTLPIVGFTSSLLLGDNAGLRDHTLTLSSSLFVSYALRSVANAVDEDDERHLPSNIVTTTFTSASFIHRRYGFIYALPVYASAGYLAHERVDINANNKEDVWTGALIGSLSGYFLTTKYKGFSLRPYAHSGTQGIWLSKTW